MSQQVKVKDSKVRIDAKLKHIKVVVLYYSIMLGVVVSLSKLAKYEYNIEELAIFLLSFLVWEYISIEFDKIDLLVEDESEKLDILNEKSNRLMYLSAFVIFIIMVNIVF